MAENEPSPQSHSPRLSNKEATKTLIQRLRDHSKHQLLGIQKARSIDRLDILWGVYKGTDPNEICMLEFEIDGQRVEALSRWSSLLHWTCGGGKEKLASEVGFTDLVQAITNAELDLYIKSLTRSTTPPSHSESI